MKALVKPSFVSGTVRVPPSKSAMQRACAAALIKKGKSILSNTGSSEDELAALEICRQLGASIEKENGKIIIESNGIHPKGPVISCGESGLSMRMFTPIAAISPEQLTITGSGSLMKRPQSFFSDVFPLLGVKYSDQNGFPPLQVLGPLKPANINIDGSLSSQFLTGLLFAYSAANAQDVSIKVQGLNSKPYIDLTLQVMSEFGLHTPVNNDHKEFFFPQQSITTFQNELIHYEVEGDWSSAAFLLVAGAIAGKLVVNGLNVFSKQADKAILQALMQAGAIMSIREEKVEISKARMQAFHFNANNCPDLFPPLVALASFCEGTSVIEGTGRLQYKESNRAHTLQREFLKMGVDIVLQDDLMIVKGGQVVKSAIVDSNNDHRIAMACAIAALRAEGEVIIENAGSVNKSWPGFWEDLRQLNAVLSLSDN